MPSLPTFVSWQTMTPDDPTNFHTICRSTVTVKAGDLLLVTVDGYANPSSTGGVVVSDNASNSWAISPNSKYYGAASWIGESFVLWYLMVPADATLNVIADGSNDSLYVESGGCGIYQFRPSTGSSWALDSSGHQAIGSASYGTSGSLTLSATSAKGLVFLRQIGNEDNSNPTIGSSIGTSIGKTNSQQTWTNSNRDTSGWTGYMFTDSAQTSLSCTFTQSIATNIGMAMDSFILQ